MIEFRVRQDIIEGVVAMAGTFPPVDPDAEPLLVWTEANDEKCSYTSCTRLARWGVEGANSNGREFHACGLHLEVVCEFRLRARAPEDAR